MLFWCSISGDYKTLLLMKNKLIQVHLQIHLMTFYYNFMCPNTQKKPPEGHYVKLTCCAVKSGWQLSRDLQHPHILAGEQKQEANIAREIRMVLLQYSTVFLMRYYSRLSVIKDCFISLPFPERQTWSLSPPLLCSTFDFPEIDGHIHEHGESIIIQLIILKTTLI